MEVIYLLIPVAVLLTSIIVGVFIWAIRHGQFDDLEGPAHRILIDDDLHTGPEQTGEAHSDQEDNTGKGST